MDSNEIISAVNDIRDLSNPANIGDDEGAELLLARLIDIFCIADETAKEGFVP